MTVSAASLSQRLREYFDSDALSTDNMDYQVLIGFKNDVVALEAEVKRLTDLNSGLSELTQGMDYCAEESDKKRKDAESRLAQAQAFLEDLKHKPYVPPWLIKGLDEALGVVGEATEK